MAHSFLPSFLPLLLITALKNVVVFIVVVKGEPDLTHISALCGSNHDESPLRRNQATRITNHAIDVTFPGAESCGSTVEKPYMYYMHTCSAAVSLNDCKACMTYAQDQMMNRLCEDQYGAQLTVGSCSLRYEIEPIPECAPPAALLEKGH